MKPLDTLSLSSLGSRTLETYAEVPYRSHAIAETHPDRMAAMAALFGHKVPDTETCRVLELGCARGDNILAMATSLPNATFVGVDGSASQIAEGETRRLQSGLDNVRLLAADFAALPEDLGEFDYVICHGVYSWVPPEIAGLLLRLCRARLAPAGIAYVSYNTYPGWSSKIMVRDMMRFHVRALPDPREQTAEARRFVRFLAQFTHGKHGLNRPFLEELADFLDGEQDHYVFHEYLEEHNRPCFFREFAAQAFASGLRYLGPAAFPAWDHQLLAEAGPGLAGLEDRIVREQYLDFLCNRSFRRSLLVCAEASVRDAPDPHAVRRLFTSARAMPVSPEPDVASEVPEEFVTEEGDRIQTTRPFVKAVFLALARGGAGFLAFDEIDRRARALLGREASESQDDLEEILLRAALANLVRFAGRSPKFAASASERPLAPPLARIQAADDLWVGNLLHRVMRLEDLDRFVLGLCDGFFDRAEIAARLVSAAERGDVTVSDAVASGAEPLRVAARAAVDASLAKLAAHAFLVR